MKYLLTLIALLTAFCLPEGTLAQVIDLDGTTTRAVVIGISDYREPLIPDLRFADRDAQAFADWLRSPQGLALPDSSIRFLANQQATTAQMIVNLDWLIEASKPGDRAFIYFSGHGDVERVTKYNRGYLLSYDSPPAVYGAGAFSLNYLQDILSTLSENVVQVFIITDACRAGKLAGSNAGGTQATAAQLAQQFANEIKILSCQPDEFSLEGEQWGGGRGCFSFHLEDALYGFADGNHDQSVELMELRRYLEDHVSAEAAPQSQLPMVFGPAKTKIADVRESEVAARRAARDSHPIVFKAIENKGMESLLLAEADTATRRLYAQFLAAVDSGFLLESASGGRSANDYFNILIQKQEIAILDGTMKRKLAAALMDEGQVVLNKVLKTDPQVLDNIWANRVIYDHLPAYFQRAAEILGEQHYVWRDLKAKEYYFRAMTVREENYPDSSADWRNMEKRHFLEKSLALDSTSAIAFYQKGLTYPGYSAEQRAEFLKAKDLAPDWALIHYWMGVNAMNYKEGITYCLKALEIDSTFLTPYNDIAFRWELIGEIDSAMYWWKKYVDKFQKRYEKDPASLKAYECEDIGITLWRLGEYEKAESFLLRGEALSEGKAKLIYGSLAVVYMDMLNFEKAIIACEKRGWQHTIGTIYFHYLHQPEKAFAAWEKAEGDAELEQVQAWFTFGNYSKTQLLAKKSAPAHYNKWRFIFYAAESARLLGLADTASLYYNHVIDSAGMKYKPYDVFCPHYVFKAISLHRLGRLTEYQRLLDTAIARLPGDRWLPFSLARIYAQTGQPNAAIASIQKAIELGWQPNTLRRLHGTLCDPMLNPIRESEGYKALVREHFPKYYDIATRVPGKH